MDDQDRRAKVTLLDVLRGEATRDQLEPDAPPCHGWDLLTPQDSRIWV